MAHSMPNEDFSLNNVSIRVILDLGVKVSKDAWRISPFSPDTLCLALLWGTTVLEHHVCYVKGGTAETDWHPGGKTIQLTFQCHVNMKVVVSEGKPVLAHRHTHTLTLTYVTTNTRI